VSSRGDLSQQDGRACLRPRPMQAAAVLPLRLQTARAGRLASLRAQPGPLQMPCTPHPRAAVQTRTLDGSPALADLYELGNTMLCVFRRLRSPFLPSAWPLSSSAPTSSRRCRSAVVEVLLANVLQSVYVYLLVVKGSAYDSQCDFLSQCSAPWPSCSTGGRFTSVWALCRYAQRREGNHR